MLSYRLLTGQSYHFMMSLLLQVIREACSLIEQQMQEANKMLREFLLALAELV